MNGFLSMLSCQRTLTKARMLRRRPMALLLLFLSLWLVLYLFSFHSSRSESSVNKDPQGEAMKLAMDQTVQQLNSARLNGKVEVSKNLSKTPAELNPEDIFEREEKEFSKRREHYDRMCHTGVAGSMGDIYYYQPAKLAVCLVPKVGLTFWTRIFRYLYKDTDGKVITSPFDIDRYDVHYGTSNRKTKVTSYYNSKALIDTFHKVLFTRDPWSRVWSSYIDKFVMPDSWMDHGVAILERRPEDKSLKVKKRCPDDVDFVEFLEYVVNTNRDVHWRPVHKVCNPCIYQPAYIGKMETFPEDTNHILRQVGLEYLTMGHNSQANYTQDEVRQLTHYHFRKYEALPQLRNCLRHSDLAERLWKAFILNGYIGKDMQFPKQEFVNALDKTTKTVEAGYKAAEMLLNYHKRSPSMTSRQMREYRRSIMTHHYRKASRQLLDKMVDIFNGDFILFDYQARPDDIFVPFPEIASENSNRTL